MVTRKGKKRVMTLKDLEGVKFVDIDGSPATLYVIIFQVFMVRMDASLEAAQRGDFSQLDALEGEVDLLIKYFIQHGAFIQERRHLIKEPHGEVAVRLNQLREVAQAHFERNQQE